MSRWTGTWLPGSGAERDSQRWPGERMGLPERGEGSVASGGVRFWALLVDLVLASLVTSLFLPLDLDDPAANWSRNLLSVAIWLVITVVGVGVIGLTPGKMLFGMRVLRVDGSKHVGLRAVPRSLLVAVIIPAAVVDRDGRGLHDKVGGTVELRTR
ncbi:RDD family protein [Actinokineospora sp. G85]|uniref:RDD family protein n=1 Tax=Actinokineospora sp. G85 TaxID=3406626 RepID=UPI003C75582C